MFALVRWNYFRRIMFSLVLPLIFLRISSVEKSFLLLVIFSPLIVLELCVLHCLQTVVDFFIKPFFDGPPKEIESNDPDEIRRGKIFIKRLMRYWQSRSIIIDEQLQCLSLFEVYIRSCFATVNPILTEEDIFLLREENGRILLKARLNNISLRLDGQILLKFLNYEQILDSYFCIDHISAYVEFDFDGRTMKNGNLIDIKIEDIKEPYVFFRGGGCLLHYVLSIAASLFMSLNYCVTRRILRTLVKKYLSLNFDKFEFIVDRDPPIPASGDNSSKSEAT